MTGKYSDSSSRCTAEDERIRFLVEAGYMALCLGDPARARTIFEGVCAALPSHHAGLVGLAEALLDLGLTAEAHAKASEAVRADGHVPGTLAWALLVQGKAALARQDRELARTLYARAREVDPHGPGARLAAQWMTIMDDQAGTPRSVAMVTGAKRSAANDSM